MDFRRSQISVESKTTLKEAKFDMNCVLLKKIILPQSKDGENCCIQTWYIVSERELLGTCLHHWHDLLIHVSKEVFSFERVLADYQKRTDFRGGHDKVGKAAYRKI